MVEVCVLYAISNFTLKGAKQLTLPCKWSDQRAGPLPNHDDYDSNKQMMHVMPIGQTCIPL